MILLDPRVWIVALLMISSAAGIGYLRGRSDGAESVTVKWKLAQAETDRLSREQQDRNRDLQRQAELRYTVQTEVRDRFLTQTILEIRHEAAPLAACPVPDAARVRFNAAARCAGGDPASACSFGEPLPVAR